jgi:LDH2 family malate/lactate/ureidoglycolate dehydrogenase
MGSDSQTATGIVAASQLAEFTAALFAATGMPNDYAELLAASLVDADLHGVSTHGVVRVPGYVAQLRSGDIDPHAAVHLEERAVSSALVDGGGTFGAIAGSRAIEWGVGAARRTGIAMCGARNVAHFGAAGYFARLAAAQGMIGIAMTNTPPAVATTGAADARLGNNPLAIATPGDEDFSLDIAMSVVSRGRVKLTADAGDPLPEGWAIDADGRPTTDARAGLDGSLLPFGGYKGAGLAIAVEILSAALTGAQLTQDAKPSGFTATPGQAGSGTGSSSVTVGHLFLVIDPEVFRPLADVEHDIHRIVDYVKGSRAAPGESIVIAGQREAALAAERAQVGIPLPAAVRAGLDELAASLGVPQLESIV